MPRCVNDEAVDEGSQKFREELEKLVQKRTRDLAEVNESLREEVCQNKGAWEALARQRDVLQTLLDNIPDRICFKDAEGRIVLINREMARALGLPDAAEACGKTDFDLLPGKDAEAYDADERRIFQTGEPIIGKVEKIELPGGKVCWYSTTKVPVKDEQGRVTGIVRINRDVTASLKTEAALRASEERYRELIENAGDVFYATDLEGRLTSLNRTGERVTGYTKEELLGQELSRLLPPEYRELDQRSREYLLRGDELPPFELEFLTKDGRRRTLEVHKRLMTEDGTPVGIQAIARDITAKKLLEVELNQAQKLESVGRLAAGIAHEINTPIQFIGDNTHFLQDSFNSLLAMMKKYQGLREAAETATISTSLLEEIKQAEAEADVQYLSEEVPKAIAQTLEGVDRVATIVRAMKEFAHPDTRQKSAADLNRAIMSTLTVARNELKYVADVETDLGDLPPVVCNISDLNQVFLNLLVNAAHAIREVVREGTDAKGKIRVRTRREGNTVLIAISDTGCGIPENIRDRIFDPFFTTKGVGRGTGQGLSIARSVVVEKHGGSLTFETEPGKGTTFLVRLPIGTNCREETGGET
jgi:PAS domain S-box-containing protein